MCSDSGGNGQSSSNQVIECKGCVCGLAVFNIILAILGLIFSSVSENAFMSLCMGSAYGGGYGYGFGYVVTHFFWLVARFNPKKRSWSLLPGCCEVDATCDLN